MAEREEKSKETAEEVAKKLGGRVKTITKEDGTTVEVIVAPTGFKTGEVLSDLPTISRRGRRGGTRHGI